MHDLMNYESLDSLASKYGNSFFVLDGDRFSKNYKSLHKAFSNYYSNVQIGYSYKTNYTPQLCDIVNKLGGYAEVVSEMEFFHAIRMGVPGDKIIFNGPVKSYRAFKEAALIGTTINLDSMNDVNMLKRVSKENPRTSIAVVIRVNFSISSTVSRFGMDADGEELKEAINIIKNILNVNLKGLHCHFPDRDLKSFEHRALGMMNIIKRVFKDKSPEIINIGGGFFSHMPHSLQAKLGSSHVGFEEYGKVIGKIFSKAFQHSEKPSLFIEPGTALVADTQFFYTKVISVKSIKGKKFATVAGSSFDISPIARSRDLPVSVIPSSSQNRNKNSYDIVGFTCIEGDVLSEGLISSINPNDFICYSNVGSYSIVMRPPFIMPSNPILFDAGEGNLILIKNGQSNEDVFRDFIF